METFALKLGCKKEEDFRWQLGLLLTFWVQWKLKITTET